MRVLMNTGIGVLLVMAMSSCGKIKNDLRGEQGGPGAAGAAGANGTDGADGQDGADAVLEVLDPCGDSPSAIDEVLIRLADGSVLVSFSANASGNNTRLAILPPGSYVTTDGTNCAFAVNADGSISN